MRNSRPISLEVKPNDFIKYEIIEGLGIIFGYGTVESISGDELYLKEWGKVYKSEVIKVYNKETILELVNGI